MPLATYLFMADRTRSLADWTEEQLEVAAARQASRRQGDGATEASVRERLASPTAAVRDGRSVHLCCAAAPPLFRAPSGPRVRA